MPSRISTITRQLGLTQHNSHIYCVTAVLYYSYEDTHSELTWMNHNICLRTFVMSNLREGHNAPSLLSHICVTETCAQCVIARLRLMVAMEFLSIIHLFATTLIHSITYKL